MNRPRFYLIAAFASRCILCAKCERFLNAVGRSACKQTLKYAAELQRLQDAAEPVSAQPADRELDPEAEPPARVSYLDDEDSEILRFLDDQRRAKEARVMAGRAAAGARRAEARRQARLACLQKRQPQAQGQRV